MSSFSFSFLFLYFVLQTNKETSPNKNKIPNQQQQGEKSETSYIWRDFVSPTTQTLTTHQKNTKQTQNHKHSETKN